MRTKKKQQQQQQQNAFSIGLPSKIIFARSKGSEDWDRGAELEGTGDG